MDIKTQEVLRYLGYRRHEADQTVKALVDHVKIEVVTSVQPKSIYKEYPLEYRSEQEITVGGVTFRSEKLRRHLRNADRILLFAATLGSQSDILVRRYQGVDSARAAVMQASLSAATESFCDEVCENIAAEERLKGYFLRPRFSPGYGDMPLESQRDFFRLLDCSRRIGLTLTDSCLMLPTKSVTAFIGLTKDEECNFNACAACGNAGCEFKRG